MHELLRLGKITISNFKKGTEKGTEKGPKKRPKKGLKKVNAIESGHRVVELPAGLLSSAVSLPSNIDRLSDDLEDDDIDDDEIIDDDEEDEGVNGDGDGDDELEDGVVNGGRSKSFYGRHSER